MRKLRKNWLAAHPQYAKEYRRKKNARWRAKNKEKHRAAVKAYYAANKEAVKARHKKWREKNAAKRAAANAAWKKANPERVKAVGAAWRKKNPDKLRVYRHKRRAQKAKVPGAVTEEQLRARAAMFGNRCAYCGGPYETDDHVLPLAKDGANVAANIRPCCKRCNSSKKDRRLGKEWTPPNAGGLI